LEIRAKRVNHERNSLRAAGKPTEEGQMPNRKERRRAATLRMEEVVMTPDQAREQLRGSICAWRGCDRVATEYHLKPGWRQLMVYGPTEPRIINGEPMIPLNDIPAGTWNRDAVLCPKHVAELESLLIDLHRWVDEVPQGSA
jgi:hypothetical protein